MRHYIVLLRKIQYKMKSFILIIVIFCLFVCNLAFIFLMPVELWVTFACTLPRIFSYFKWRPFPISYYTDPDLTSISIVIQNFKTKATTKNKSKKKLNL